MSVRTSHITHDMSRCHVTNHSPVSLLTMITTSQQRSPRVLRPRSAHWSHPHGSHYRWTHHHMPISIEHQSSDIYPQTPDLIWYTLQRDEWMSKSMIFVNVPMLSKLWYCRQWYNDGGAVALTALCYSQSRIVTMTVTQSVTWSRDPSESHDPVMSCHRLML